MRRGEGWPMHGRLAANLIASLTGHVKRTQLGVMCADTGFRLATNPEIVRAPDVAFVRAGRSVETDDFLDGPPDAAFEVVSPNDSDAEIEEKTLDWLRAGAQVVIIADPRTRSIRVHRTSGAVKM